MRRTEWRRSETDVYVELRERLWGRGFLVTPLANLDAIIEAGEIRPNTNGDYAGGFGQYNSFFRNRGCVSLFDYRDVPDEHVDMYVGRCHPAQAASLESGIAIFILRDPDQMNLVSWMRWKEEETWREMVVPYIETGHEGPISLTLIEERIHLEVKEDPDGWAAMYRRADRRVREEEGSGDG